MSSRLFRILRPTLPFAVAAAGVVLLSQQVVATTLTRTGTLACIALAIAAVAFALRNSRRALAAFAAAIAAPVVLVTVWPAKSEISAEEEGSRAAQAALRYEGVGYVWGGESSRGIDCSGLVRRAYIDAALSTAWHDASPAHLRRALIWWWRDTTARQFENHAPVRGKRLGLSQSLRDDIPTGLRPGDLAIVGSGVHVLMYLGENRWIQADPMTHRVLVSDSRTNRDAWMEGKAVLLRPTL